MLGNNLIYISHENIEHQIKINAKSQILNKQVKLKVTKSMKRGNLNKKK